MRYSIAGDPLGRRAEGLDEGSVHLSESLRVCPGDHLLDEGDPGRAPLDRVVEEEEPGEVVELDSLPGQRSAEPARPEGGEGFGIRRGGEPPGGRVERLRCGNELKMGGDDHRVGHRTEHRLPVEAEAHAPGSGSAG